MGETLVVKRIEPSKGLKYMVWVFYIIGALALTHAWVKEDVTTFFLGLFQMAMGYLLLFVFTYDKVIFTGEGIVMKGLGNNRNFSKQSIRAIAGYTSEVNVGKSILKTVFVGRVTSGSVMVKRVPFRQLADAKVGIGAKLL